MTSETKLIEHDIPVDVLSRDAAIEMSFKPRASYYARCKELGIQAPKSFYDPKIRNIHPWLARRPRSVARALNLASLLPVDFADKFLTILGFDGKLKNLVDKGYPPLISYTSPQTEQFKIDFRDKKLLDPMAGGGTIPLESLILGIDTIACEYNPIAFLLLKATVEFPAKYGSKLYQRVQEESISLINYAKQKLKSFYSEDAEGYIVLRQILLNDKIVPLASKIPLTSKSYISLENNQIKLLKGKSQLVCNKDLLPLWMKQHSQLMKGTHIAPLDILHRCLVVQTKKGFRIANKYDQQLLEKAFKEYFDIKHLLPNISLPVDNEVFRDILPLEEYPNLFNPRQALALGLIIKYVRERIEELVEKEGEFGAATGLYLAFGIDKLVDFNSIITTWNSNQATVRSSIGSYYKFRRFRLEGIYAEAIVPFKTLEWIFEPNSKSETTGGICPILKELCEKLEGKGNKIKVKLCNVLELFQIMKEKVDVVNVDPPYYDQHIYSDFSEFFWPFLKTSLDKGLDFLFEENFLPSWNPNCWRSPKKDEVISRNSKDNFFEVKLKKALTEIKKVLQDDGLLILWFSHRKLEAWEALIKALQGAGFRLTNIIPLISEHPTRSITKGGTSGFSHVLVLIARKSENTFTVKKEELKKRVIEQAKKAKIYPSEEIGETNLKIISSAVDLAISLLC
ncbi:MAG: hypothetical protein QW321_01940 [Candidatus Aenigmatarchaeota archaeon]